jgi:hypothetical protein
MAYRFPTMASQTMANRRQRIHELVLTLLSRQTDLELLRDDASHGFEQPGADPRQWLQHNQSLIRRYQRLVRSAITIDALIDQEAGGPGLEGRED